MVAFRAVGFIRLIRQGVWPVVCPHRDGKGVRRRLVVAFMVLLASAMGGRAVDVVLLQNTTVDSNAVNFATGAATKFSMNINGRTYQQNAVSTFNGYQYTTYYDANRNVCLGRRQLPRR